jgi:transposase-like protein
MTAVEVITSVERRRRWSRDEKLRIVAESARPGRTTSRVARDHGIAPASCSSGGTNCFRKRLQRAGGDCPFKTSPSHPDVA